MRPDDRQHRPAWYLRAVAALAFGLMIAAPTFAQRTENESGRGVQVPANGRIAVIGREFRYSPDAIRVHKDQHVVIVFRNEGALSHNLTIPELGLHTGTVQTGATDSIEFTAKRAGTYRFWCTVAGHREAGMTGELIIDQ